MQRGNNIHKHMKSFKQYITEASVLMDLINKHDDPFSFLASAMDAISSGTLKLKTRGLANARELIAAWNKKKKRQIKLKEAPDFSPRPPLEDPAWPDMQPIHDPNNPDSGVDVWSDGTNVWAWDGTEWVKIKLPEDLRKKKPPLREPWDRAPTRYA